MTQNIVSWQGFTTKPSSMIKFSMDSWWDAGKRLGVSDSQQYESRLRNFADMVYSKTTKIGCAYNVCGKEMTFSCLYNANIENTKDPMWETGTACKTADDCTTYDNSGCEDGLCTVGSETNVTETPEFTNTPEAPETTVVPTAETPS
ncbi:hypothetical protein OESDEN_19564, partial [Oesophagostomum dentatum]